MTSFITYILLNLLKKSLNKPLQKGHLLTSFEWKRSLFLFNRWNKNSSIDAGPRATHAGFLTHLHYVKYSEKRCIEMPLAVKVGNHSDVKTMYDACVLASGAKVAYHFNSNSHWTDEFILQVLQSVRSSSDHIGLVLVLNESAKHQFDFASHHRIIISVVIVVFFVLWLIKNNGASSIK